MTYSITAAKRRLKYELGLLVLLLAGLGGVMLWRARSVPVPAPPSVPWGTQFEYAPGKFAEVRCGTGTSTTIDATRFADPDKKTSEDLVQFALQAWENQWGYVWGTYGTVLTEELLAYKSEQYPTDVGGQESFIREAWLGRRTVDCMGLIKGYGWYQPDTGTIDYGSGAMPDVGTEGLFEAAAVKGAIDTIPETPGLIVYASGHVGVYIGSGEVIEAISTEGGVVKTQLSNRHFTHWLECPYIEY